MEGINGIYIVVFCFYCNRCDGRPFPYKPIDRKITREEFIKAATELEYLDELIERFGEPNGFREDLTDVIYELVSDCDEPLYAVISYGATSEEIYWDMTYFTHADGAAEWFSDVISETSN